jgi:putative transposase
MEAGRRAEDVAREQGVSKHTIHPWKTKYGGMEFSEAQEVKQLRDENARLKKLVAELTLDKDMLQSVQSLAPVSERRGLAGDIRHQQPDHRLVHHLRCNGQHHLRRHTPLHDMMPKDG